MSTRIKVTQVKSIAGTSQKQRATMKLLGLGKINRSAMVSDSPQTQGMIRTVRHLITVDLVQG
jgi:large subunit ribosomal protein L30